MLPNVKFNVNDTLGTGPDYDTIFGYFSHNGFDICCIIMQSSMKGNYYIAYYRGPVMGNSEDIIKRSYFSGTLFRAMHEAQNSIHHLCKTLGESK